MYDLVIVNATFQHQCIFITIKKIMSWMKLFRRKKPTVNPEAKPEEKTTALTAKANRVAVDSNKDRKDKNPSTEAVERLNVAKQRHRQGNITQAEAVYLDILKQEPEYADAHHMVAVVNLQKGQFEKAEKGFKQAIALDNSQTDFYSNLGNALAAQNRVNEAYESFKQATVLDDSNFSALGNAATALLTLGRSDEAKSLCLKILAAFPDDISALMNLASVHLAQHDTHAAITLIRKGIVIDPDNVELKIQLASNLELINQLDEAERVIEDVVTSQPAMPRASLIRGVILRRQNKLIAAEKSLKTAIKQGLSAKEQIEAFNQLGLALDASGKNAEAFKAFVQSNNIMAKVCDKDETNAEQFITDVKAIKAYFSNDKLAQLTAKHAAIDDFNPVFFVGFPRSGTTLMEQILKAHPQLVTTDERSPLAIIINEIRAIAGGYPQGLDNLTRDDIARMRQHYIDICHRYFDDVSTKQVVDKLPLNIVHLGLAKLLFPQAKIIVALRDPRAVCLSCFMQKFDINNAMANFLDIEKTANAYEAVMDLWLHYRKILAGSWFEYKYENLVDNFDATVTATLEFIGVGWHAEINSYRQAAKTRAITTPSYRDVTAPINRNALARWQSYQPNLQGVLPKLAPFVEVFDYDN
ncbi:hypothetical protein A9Q98_12015 [Thalassotalea sp. 42_200_T64]|nr:hypothetical protein A9Q98_12015 [Thalassotalea sp. 42_200_T64]